ncbi:PEP-CTERM sorting domain-containing protein [Nostoc sp. FACHB-892]|uniref:PEP-CTERM sorting domain-containing protein n=1 Tax=Nostoc sp. FACHB-892 TaxID=2692843 RepID=UPI001683E5E5|nr:PEP-CTERM sorting domain-containing protein [Nostoc sp. FACHB-892]MBD2725293.1 PEP-CTERM sorting domain-containing protein [Nostoc sp. FACHB-892]
MKKSFSFISASVLLFTGITCASIAAPVYATSNANQTSSAICQLSDISLGGVLATACEGPIAGNDTGDKGSLLPDLNNGLFSSFVGTNVKWSLAGKSDENPFAITADNKLSSGTWRLGEALASNTFVVSLKAGDAYTAYLFKDYDFSKGLTGVFNTIGVALEGNGKAGKELSHASLFVPKTGTNPPPTSVPEPASLLGLGLVASGMVMVRRRRAI